MFVTLYKSSPEGMLSVEIEQQYLPDALASSLQIPTDEHIQENIKAGWDYWWHYDEISDRQRYRSMEGAL